MLCLAKDLNLTAIPCTKLCKIFPQICSKFGWYELRGKFRGEPVRIFPSSPKSNLARYVAVQISIAHLGLDLNISIRYKPLFWQLQKILNKYYTEFLDPILDNKLLALSNDSRIFCEIFHYDEIRDQMYDIWGKKKDRGQLLISRNFVTYYEPLGIFTPKKRQQLINVCNLISDIVDVLKILNHSSMSRPAK